MKLFYARSSCLLLRDDGSIHFPFSKFLTNQFSNPHTSELVSQSLRIFHRFCMEHEIELAYRATEGRCLSFNEAKNLADLCFRPMREIEAMGDKKVVFLSRSKAGRAPKELPGAVEPNTAKKRLDHIAHYLDFYRGVFLDPNIRSGAIRDHLKSEYDKIRQQLLSTIRGTKQNHHLSVQSLPTDKYFSVIESVFVSPEKLLQTETGQPSRNFLRERAMVLLACEGLRPGTIGNICLADFRPNSGHLFITDNRAKRSERVTTNTPKHKMGDSTQVNSASEIMISLWPFTVRAIQDYIEFERSAVLMKRLTNRSNGFLFLNSEGEPIKHRSSITALFNKLGKRLATTGLLDVGSDPYFKNQDKYDFYGYVLRHSAASFFLGQKCTEITNEFGVDRPRHYMNVPDRVKDLMKLRFGWTMNSKMPELYAARALSDNANIVLMDFNKSLMEAVQSRKREKERGE